MKVNGTEKEFILDSGLPISTMSTDNEIMNQTEKQKVKRRSLDVTNNENNPVGKPIDIDYGKQNK